MARLSAAELRVRNQGLWKEFHAVMRRAWPEWKKARKLHPPAEVEVTVRVVRDHAPPVELVRRELREIVEQELGTAYLALLQKIPTEETAG